MRNIIYIPIALLIFSLLSGCVYDRASQKLIIVNNTNRPLYFRHLSDKSYLTSGLYVYRLNAHRSEKPYIWGGDEAWESFVNHSPNSTLKLYVFDTIGINFNKLTQQVIDQQKYKQLRYTVNDLERINWKVVISE